MPSSKTKLAEVVLFHFILFFLLGFIMSHNNSPVNKIGCCHAGRLSLSRQNIKVSNLALTSSGDFTTFPKLKAAVLYNLP